VHGILFFYFSYNTTINVIYLLQFCHLFSESRCLKFFGVGNIGTSSARSIETNVFSTS